MMAAARASHKVKAMRRWKEGTAMPKIERQDRESTKMTKVEELSMPTSNTLASLRRQLLMVVPLLWTNLTWRPATP